MMDLEAARQLLTKAGLGRLGLRRAQKQTALTRDTFDAWALDGRDRKMELGHGPIARRIFDSLHLAEDARYLDIGCGNGYTVRWAAAAAPRGQAVGIDLSPHMTRRARELSAGIPNAIFREASFPNHELERTSFDAIFSMETLYYLSDPVEGLSEACRLLKPGGIFVSAIDIYREHPMSRHWIGYVGLRVKLWSGPRWRRAFERAGFTDVSQERMLLPAEEAVERWHATTGCLVTRGRRPR